MSLGALSASLISGPTAQALTFQRATPFRAGSGEVQATFADVLTATCDVQPVRNTRVLNTRLATTYGQMFDLFISGTVDVRRNDRVMVGGVECIVESVQPYGDHTEVLVGARQ